MAKDIKFNIKLKHCRQESHGTGISECEGVPAQPYGGEDWQSAVRRNDLNQAVQMYSNFSDAIGSMSHLMTSYISRANSATEAQTKLTMVIRQRMGATVADAA